MIVKTFAIATALCLSIGAAQAAPSVSAMTFASVGFQSEAFITSTRGYAFSVTAPGLAATHLGIYDENGDGLGEAHELGLWDSTGTLIASAPIAAGSGALLQDSFRYVDITDVPLPVGDYVVGATFTAGTPDNQAYQIAGLAMAAGLQYTQARFINNGLTTLTLPTSSLPDIGLPGGSLMVAAAAAPSIPEPSSLALLGLGLAGVALRRRLRG